MFAEFINRPLSGDYPEKHFGAASPNCSWVKFTDKNYQDWVGSFQNGWEENGTFILKIDSQDKLFIVAGGYGYLIDINTREQLNKIAIKDTKSAVVDKNKFRIYYSNGFDLRHIDINGNISILYDDYYFDDIKLIEVRDNKLYANYWYYQRGSLPFHFEIDVETKEIKDSYYDSEKSEYSYENPNLSLIEKFIKWLKKKASR